jgi:hypothetical protein
MVLSPAAWSAFTDVAPRDLLAVRAVMMKMVMMPPTVMVMAIIAVLCARSLRMSAMVIRDRHSNSAR